MFTFAHISDTHFGTTPDFTLYDANPHQAAQQLVKQVNGLAPDFVVHTGDVVADEDEIEAYQLAQSVLGQIDAPVYYVTGNHDRSVHLKWWMAFGEKVDVVHSTETLAYRFTHKDNDFLILDGRGTDEMRAEGVISAEQLAYLQNLPQQGNPLSIFVHFAAFPLNSDWIDNGMLLQNGFALHNALLPLRDRLRGVFHGHLHQAMHVMRDGITYICAPSAFQQFNLNRAGGETVADPHTSNGFNCVQCMQGQTVVRRVELRTIDV